MAHLLSFDQNQQELEEVTVEENQQETKEVVAGQENLPPPVVQTLTKLDCANKMTFSDARSMDIDKEVYTINYEDENGSTK